MWTSGDKTHEHDDRNSGIDGDVGDAQALIFFDPVGIGDVVVAVGDHVDKEVGNKPEGEADEGVADDGAEGGTNCCVGGEGHNEWP